MTTSFDAVCKNHWYVFRYPPPHTSPDGTSCTVQAFPSWHCSKCAEPMTKDEAGFGRSRKVLLAFVFAIIAVLLAPMLARAENSGSDYLAFSQSNFKCGQALSVFDAMPVARLGYLFNTFSPDLSCLPTFFAINKPKVFRGHLWNGTCQRNKNCFPYELLYGLTVKDYEKKLVNKNPQLLNTIRQYANPFADFLSQHLNSQATCLLSPELESNVNAKAAEVLLETLKPLFPSVCRWVWNPVNHNPARPKGYDYLEQHGQNPKVKPPCITSLDGEDAPDLSTFWKKSEKCEVAFYWEGSFNCREPGKPFIDPRKRVKCPTAEQFKSTKQKLDATTKPPPVVPTPMPGCKAQSPHDGLKQHFVWKPVGDNVPEAVVVLPEKYVGDKAKVKVWANGKPAGECKLKTTGICPGHPECLHRPTFRCAHSGQKYKDLYGSITLRVEHKGNCVTYFLPDPSIRVD